MKTDCNSRYVYLNPYVGGMIAVAESARNVVCTGATPLAITNCLNFGNPYKPEVYWQFKEAVAGIAEACRAFGTPVTGGNVSFYNESPTGSAYPTPVIGMLGLIDDVSTVVTSSFKQNGDTIMLLGETKGQIGGSEYLQCIHGKVEGDAPTLNLELEKGVQGLCLAAIDRKLVHSAHDCSEGGLAVALAECCIAGEPKGCIVDLGSSSLRLDFHLYGEDQSRIIISTAAEDVSRICALAEKQNVPVAILGEVGGSSLVVKQGLFLELENIEKSYNSLRP